MERKNAKITGLLVLVVFALFAVCILMVLLTGAKTYEALVNRGDTAYEYRTAARYLAARVQQSDVAGGIFLEDFGGCSTLVLRQEIDGEGYLTRVYCHEGHLRELFTAEGGSFAPEDGEKLLEMESLRFAWEAGGLSARFVTAEGEPVSLYFHLRCREVLP